MITPKKIKITAADTIYYIQTFNSHSVTRNLIDLPINIFASGPSITNIVVDDILLDTASIFVNGSLSLTNMYSFTNVVGYVISDKRFIKNNREMIDKYYKGQPLYTTISVIKEMADKLPHIIEKFYESIIVIHPADRPSYQLGNSNKYKHFIHKLIISKKLINRKKPLKEFEGHPSFYIDTKNTPQPIGVSFDMSDGFVEAGTVAYVASQLAFSLGATEINLYGIDLLNSTKPRFYEKKDNIAPCKLSKAVSDRIVPSFNLLANAYKKNGVSVINHSPVSKNLFNF